jgi:iron-sulfur cluster repair protein YtfE (RIC family)
MDAIDILHEDHEKFFPLFEKLDSAEKLNKKELDAAFKELEHILLQHMKSEEKIFYPAAQAIPGIKSLIEKSYQAHHLVKIGLIELHLLPYGAESWKPKFQAIKDSILMHMAEEEKEVFPKLKQLISPEALNEMGNEIKEYRK